MVESNFEVIFTLFDWSKKNKTYVVHFHDGDIIEITKVFIGQDLNDQPHATAQIVRILFLVNGKNLSINDSLFFYLSDIYEIKNPENDLALYRFSNSNPKN